MIILNGGVIFFVLVYSIRVQQSYRRHHYMPQVVLTLKAIWVHFYTQSILAPSWELNPKADIEFEAHMESCNTPTIVYKLKPAHDAV